MDQNINSRPNWHTTFIQICDVIKNRSTCLRLQTAAIIVKNNNIISMGYNGVPTKHNHCYDFWKELYDYINNIELNPSIEIKQFYNDQIEIILKHDTLNKHDTFDKFIESDMFKELHHIWATTNELHGEINAMLQCESNMKDAILYTLYSPCIQCAKSIVSAKIKEVYYCHEYKRDQTGINFLQKCGIKIEQIKLI